MPPTSAFNRIFKLNALLYVAEHGYRRIVSRFEKLDVIFFSMSAASRIKLASATASCGSL